MNESDSPPIGRPRSNEARLAVLHAVDDILVEDGYAAMTMTGIAARAGVGKQTVYRWWKSKAEILLEAAMLDAASELAVAPAATSAEEIDQYLSAVEVFLTTSPAGAAYRALVGEAQHDPKVAALVRRSDVLLTATIPLVKRRIERGDLPASTDLAAESARMVGPLFYRILTAQTAG